MREKRPEEGSRERGEIKSLGRVKGESRAAVYYEAV